LLRQCAGKRHQCSAAFKPWARIGRCFEPRLPPACIIGLDFHAPRVAALPFETQNAITGRIDSKAHGRPIRMIRNPQAISYRLMSALHCVPIPADECYRQRSRFVYVTLPIWIIGQDCHAANFCLAWLLEVPYSGLWLSRMAWRRLACRRGSTTASPDFAALPCWFFCAALVGPIANWSVALFSEPDAGPSCGTVANTQIATSRTTWRGTLFMMPFLQGWLSVGLV